MFFLNPLFLYSLAAGALPIIVHFISGKKAKPHKFSAVKYVLLSTERVARRYKLKQWLLLALRAAAVLALALALAHPVFIREGGLFAFQGPPLAKVLIVDNSMSMGYRDADGDRLSKAKAVAMKFVESMRPEDRLAVMTAFYSERENDEAGRAFPPLTGDKDRLREAIEEIELSYGGADFKRAFEMAGKILASDHSRNREIIVIGDLYASGWERFAPSPQAGATAAARVRLLKLQGTEPARNISIKAVSVGEFYLAAGTPLRLEAHMANHSDSEVKDLIVELHIDGAKVDQKFINLGQNSDITVDFQILTPESGHHRGIVRVGKDNLEADNTYYFSFESREKVKVLAVDGDPKSSLVYSETYYLAAALSPPGTASAAPITVATVLEHELDGIDFGSYSDVFLCNLRSLGSETRTRLLDFGARGGGIAIFPGDKVAAQVFNEELFSSTTRISPAPLMELTRYDQAKPASISRIEAAHPIFVPFADDQSPLEKANFWAAFKTSPPEQAEGAKVLARLSDGNPLITEGSLGKGRTLLFASTCDRDWNDLPSKTAYLPLVQKMAFYLAGATGKGLDDQVEVGRLKEIAGGAESAGKSATVIRPDGSASELTMAASEKGSKGAVGGNDLPGVYQVTLGAEKIHYFANPPAKESALSPVDEEWLKEMFAGGEFEVIDISREWDKPGARPEAQDQILAYLFFTLFGLIAAEIIVAGRF